MRPALLSTPAALAVLLTAWLSAVGAATAAPAPAAANGLDAAVLARVDQLARQGASQTGWRYSRIEVDVGALDPRLQLAPCQTVEPYLPVGLPAWGRTRIGLRCVQGAKPWNVTLPVTVKVWARSLVTTSALSAGVPLDASQLMEAEIDLAAAPGTALSRAADVVGRSLARPLPAGSALRQTDLKPRQWFNAGDTVRVLAVGSGWSIASEGQALGPGIEGQPARVRMESGRMVQAIPVADRQAEISL